MSLFVPMAIIACSISAGPATHHGPDMMEFIMQSVTEGLTRDGVTRELASKMAAHEDDFVAKCLLCKATRGALYEYANRRAGPGPCTLDAKTIEKLTSADANVRRAALRDLIGGYLDHSFANTKMTAAERKDLQKQMAAEREQSMGIKPKQLEYCPSCDGVCCQAPPDQAVDFGLAVNGVASRLTLVTKRPQVGKPLRVRLELKNVGSLAMRYDSQQAAVNNSLVVKGPDGKAVPYIATSFQTMGSPKHVQPGETNTILADLNVTEQYLMDRAGKYVIKFVGRGGIPPSNEVSVELADGRLPDMDRLFLALREIAPEGWRAVRYGDSISFLNTPTRLKADATSVTLYFTKEKKSGFEERQVQPKYLGEMIVGHAWLQQQSEVATDRWPDHEKAIEEKLKGFRKSKP